MTEPTLILKISKIANLPTKFGEFKMICVFDRDQREHAVLFKGDIESQEDITVRVHSECLTGDVFHSLKCDCGEQLTKYLQLMSNEDKALLIYLRQEGRGIGLFNKVNAYNLQDEGFDTVEANIELGLKEDIRNYKIVTEILEYFKIKSITLLTNNLDKLNQIRQNGIFVNQSKTLSIKPNKYNENYLKVKKNKMNHTIEQL